MLDIKVCRYHYKYHQISFLIKLPKIELTCSLHNGETQNVTQTSVEQLAIYAEYGPNYSPSTGSHPSGADVSYTSNFYYD